jgi:hypothetical protein
MAFLSDFRFSPTAGGVVLRGGVATGGLFKAFAAILILESDTREPKASSFAPMMKAEGWDMI